jgi:hypothetical protein
MAYQPNQRQALCLVGMLFGQSDAEREPMQSKVKPELPPKDRKGLIEAGFLEARPRGRATHLILTDAAWEWAGAHLDGALLESKHATGILQAVLTQLGKFLAARELTLADVAMASSASRTPEASDSTALDGSKRALADAPPPALAAPDIERAASPSELGERIRQAIWEIAGGAAKRRVRLAELRDRLIEVPRPRLDSSLLELQDTGRVVLYPLDNPVELTAADREAALLVGQNPRHIVYLES